MIKITEEMKVTIIDKIQNHDQGLFGLIERDKFFETTTPYPDRKDYNIKRKCSHCKSLHEDKTAKLQFEADMRKYRDDQHRLNQLFKFAALWDCGIHEHPKADKAYEMAYSRGHSSGIWEIYQNLVELADLLRG
jgi:hypothetical protein